MLLKFDVVLDFLQTAVLISSLLVNLSLTIHASNNKETGIMLGIMGYETIFVMESYYGRDVVEEFENMDKFKAGVTRKTHKLPTKYDGTGAVVYGPYLYYNR